MPRNRWIIAPLLLIAVALLVMLGLNHTPYAAHTDADSSPSIVAHVELPRYMGRWYEIASVPMYFQRNCAKNTQATYTLLTNGHVEVLNQCTRTNGKVIDAQGRATAVPNSGNAKLKVSFLNLLGWWVPFAGGDYWIMDLDANYQTALIGHPTRKYGWILSRTPKLSDAKLTELKHTLQGKGYDTCEFILTAQDGGLPPEAAHRPLCDEALD